MKINPKMMPGLLLSLPGVIKSAVKAYSDLENKCILLSITTGKPVKELMALTIERMKTGPRMIEAFEEIKSELKKEND